MLKQAAMRNCKMNWPAVAIALSATVTILTGCSENNDRVPVSGTVIYEGQPVTGGTLTFVPMVVGQKGKNGRPATGVVGADGTFVLGTDSDGDGALIADHRVSYSAPVSTWEAPEWDGKGKPPTPPVEPFAGLMVKSETVQVREGPNIVQVELQAPPKPGGRRS